MMNLKHRNPPLPPCLDAARRLDAIARQQLRRPAAATVSLGDAGLDAALHEGGLELGVVHEVVPADRKRVVDGKSVSVRVDFAGRRYTKKQPEPKTIATINH